MAGSANRTGNDGFGNTDGGVTWPLSLSANLSTTKDSNNVNWSTTATYPEADVSWLFEVNTGDNLFDVLNQCTQITANAQYNVKPDGTIHIAKLLGTDRSATILLSIPQSTNNVNSLRNTDTRSYMYASNGYLFESQSTAAGVNRFGRREGFVDADQSEGQLVSEIARTTLDDVGKELDEFTFAYIETDTTRAFIDFEVGDTVSIEYEPGKVVARQVTGLSCNADPSGVLVEVVVGDIVDNAIATLTKTQNTNQDNPLITVKLPGMNKPGKLPRRIFAPTITATTVKREGLSRSVKINFKTPGWVGTQEMSKLAAKIGHFEAQVYLDSDPEVKFTTVEAIDRTGIEQAIVVTGMGSKGGTYRARVRAIGGLSGTPISDWAISSTFTLTETGEGGASDPFKPAQVTGLSVFPMLNSALVKFTDFQGSSNPTISGNRGSYEIQISNATSGSFSESGNSWTRTIGGDTSGETGSGPKVFRVPNGTGFICTGLYSEAGGRTHYVKVRAINTDGTAGDFSAVTSVSLDTSDESQTGVIIGENSITANAILAGTITATEISAGSITADRLDADQVVTSAIRMPQPSGATNAGALSDGTSGNEIKFSIDKDGNMWWGNFTSYANADSRTPASGSVGGNDVMTRFKGDGTEYVIGTPNQYVGFTSALGAYSKALSVDGSATIDGTLTVNSSTGIKAGNTSLNSTRIQFGTNPYVTIDHSAGTFFGGTTPAIKWGSTIGGSQYGYIAGGALNVGGFGALNMIAMGINNSNVIFSSGGAVGFLTGSGSHITLDGDNGIVISDNGVPTSTSGRMYRSGSTLYWNGSALVTGSSSMDIAGLTTSTPGNPAFTFIPWAYSTAGTERKMSVTTLAQELLSTGEFLNPDTGGTVVGDLILNGDLKMGSGKYIRGNTSLELRHSATAGSSGRNFILYSFGNYSYMHLYPGGGSNLRNLGSSTSRWEDIYVDDILNYGSYNFLSDENAKTDISDETKGLAFIKSLRARTFKWKEVSKKDGSGEMRAGVRTHHGFIAQEVETALASEAANDALWINMHSPAQEERRDESGEIVQEATEESYKQGLRITEFIGPIVKAIQELAARVEALEG